MYKTLLRAVVMAAALSSGLSHAAMVSLDVSNDWTYEIEPGALMMQPSAQDDYVSALLQGVGIVFAEGPAGLADFVAGGVSRIGDGVRIDGKGPRRIIGTATPLAIQVLASGNLYDLRWLYTMSDEGPNGVLPPGFSDPNSAVFDIRRFSPVPLISSLALIAFGMVGFASLAFRQKRCGEMDVGERR